MIVRYNFILTGSNICMALTLSDGALNANKICDA